MKEFPKNPEEYAGQLSKAISNVACTKFRLKAAYEIFEENVKGIIEEIKKN